MRMESTHSGNNRDSRLKSKRHSITDRIEWVVIQDRGTGLEDIGHAVATVREDIVHEQGRSECVDCLCFSLGMERWCSRFGRSRSSSEERAPGNTLKQSIGLTALG